MKLIEAIHMAERWHQKRPVDLKNDYHLGANDLVPDPWDIHELTFTPKGMKALGTYLPFQSVMIVTNSFGRVGQVTYFFESQQNKVKKHLLDIYERFGKPLPRVTYDPWLAGAQSVAAEIMMDNGALLRIPFDDVARGDFQISQLEICHSSMLFDPSPSVTASQTRQWS